MGYLLYYGGKSRGCFYYIILEGLRDIYIILVEEFRGVFTVVEGVRVVLTVLWLKE